ncbi:MAG: rRNA pseudouridine synthase [Alphaproteobacteria bacterium]|nr:rRNA pseudouridine synthase [Alphaproteobacteria bacterium]
METNIKKYRLAKKIAESGLTSRRQAEDLILSGHVKVDGKIVNTPVFFVTEKNLITVDEKLLPKQSDEIIIWKFYKPRGVITSRSDNNNRPTVFDYFKEIKNERILYVGRLDCNSEGLLLFVNNGDIARKMELPSTALEITYRVRIFGNLSEKAIEKLKFGVTIKGIKYGSAKVEEENPKNKSKNHWVKVTLSEGKNREIRKLMQYFGCRVNKLIRIKYGPFKLDKLRPGNIEKIKKHEIQKFLSTL